MSSFTLSAQDSIARAEVIPILRAVHDTLANHHPFAFVGDGRARISAALETILPRADSLLASRSGDSLAYPEVMGLAAPLQAAVGCGHTHLRVKDTPARGKALNRVYSAVSAFRVTNGDYVLNQALATTKDSLARGTKIIALEGRPVAPLVNSLARFYGVNDHDYLPATAYIIAGNLDYYYRYAYGPRDTVAITVSTDAGVSTYFVPLRPVTAGKKKSKKEKILPYRFTFSEDSSAAHLRILSFNDSSWKGFNANKEMNRIINELRELNIDDLVIDLRGNLGGNLRRTRDIYRHFATEPFAAISKMESYSPDARPDNPFHALGTYLIGGRRRIAGGYHKPGFYKQVRPFDGKRGYRGNLAVLINERTFSAATLFAHLVQATARGPLVGSVSGGATDQTYGGSFTDYPIGESRQLEINLPDYSIQPWRPRPGNLTPDHLVGYTAGDIASGKDVRLEFAYEVLARK